MLLNISTDQIICLEKGSVHVLPYSNIERTFGPWLHKLIETYSPSHVYVINGPGGFSILRVCCLTINLIKQKYAFKLFETTKTDLFSWIQLNSDFPKHVALFIGQKKSCWFYDCVTKKYEKIAFTERQNQAKLLIDPLIDLSLVGGKMYESKILQLKRNDQQKIILVTKDKQWTIDFNAPCWQERDFLTANYLIDPTMG